MIVTIHIVSMLIGFIPGVIVGAAIALYACWKTDEEFQRLNGNHFSNGFDKGWNCGVAHQKLINHEEHLKLKEKMDHGS